MCLTLSKCFGSNVLWLAYRDIPINEVSPRMSEESSNDSWFRYSPGRSQNQVTEMRFIHTKSRRLSEIPLLLSPALFVAIVRDRRGRWVSVTVAGACMLALELPTPCRRFLRYAIIYHKIVRTFVVLRQLLPFTGFGWFRYSNRFRIVKLLIIDFLLLLLLPPKMKSSD